ncbi:MAG: acyltransferase [Prevotellaceae bacterium]|nr:acyltransferase [Prevotellaceae bacterium]
MLPAINENLSKRISSLRFLLIVFVVFAHNNPTTVNFANGTETYDIPSYVNVVRRLISEIRTTIPLFFLLSGFLLYAKETKLTTVLKKKSRTILLPYLLWNALTILFYYIAQSFSFTEPYFATNIVRNFTIMDYVGAFTGKAGIYAEHGGTPIAYPLWFLRDLFILNLAFIGIKKLVDKFPLGTLMLFVILWIGSIDIYVVSPEALLFFTLGYYAVKYSLDIRKLDSLKMYDIVALYAITIVIELFFKESVPVIHNLNIVIGSIFFLKLTQYFVSSQKVFGKLLWLEGYAFWVYVAHAIPLSIMTKLSVKIIPMHDGWLLLQYFGVSITAVVILVAMGAAVKKLFPKTYTVLTSGRT